MNLLEKMQLKKQLKEVRKNNSQVKDFLTHIKESYPLNAEEVNNINQIGLHMDNLNVIFSQMQSKAIK